MMALCVLLCRLFTPSPIGGLVIFHAVYGHDDGKGVATIEATEAVALVEILYFPKEKGFHNGPDKLLSI